MDELTIVSIRQKHSIAVWQERIRNCRNSNQSVVDWCRENAINSKTYYHWERKLLLQQAEEHAIRNVSQQAQAQPRFVEISATNTASEVVAVLQADTFTCEIRSGISPDQLSAIIEVIKHHA